eukprot:5496954-Lingulodinium_polyedra.AAC.1
MRPCVSGEATRYAVGPWATSATRPEGSSDSAGPGRPTHPASKGSLCCWVPTRAAGRGVPDPQN